MGVISGCIWDLHQTIRYAGGSKCCMFCITMFCFTPRSCNDNNFFEAVSVHPTSSLRVLHDCNA